MDDNTKLIESLLERVVEYGKASLELAKLKALDKTSGIVSTVIPHAVVFVLIASFMLFFNLGLAFWLGLLLGQIYFGFILVAGFYGLTAIVVHFFMHKWFKKLVCDYFIKQMLN